MLREGGGNGFPPLLSKDRGKRNQEMLKGSFIRGAARWPTRTMGKFAPSTRMMPIVRGFSTHQQPGLGQAGTVWCWGHSDDGLVREPECFPDMGPCTSASCGLYHVGAITADGALHTWGRGEGGRLGNREGEFSINRGGVIPLHAPDPHPVDFETPLREFGVPALKIPLVSEVACGGLHTLARLSDGRAMAFGFGRFGQLGLGWNGEQANFYTPLQILTLHPVVSIAAGGSHSAAIDVHGDVFTWGRADQGRLGYRDASTTEHEPKCVELLKGHDVASVHCGGFHTAALTKDGKQLFMWGAGENGELGTGRSKNEQQPTLVQELSGDALISLSLGGFHSAAVTENGDVLTWGGGSLGQLGHGDDARQMVPTRVKGIPPAAQVACGGGHTAVVTRSGELWVFGANGEGQLGVSCNVSRDPVMVEKLGHTRVLSIACGGSKTAAITGDR